MYKPSGKGKQTARECVSNTGGWTPHKEMCIRDRFGASKRGALIIKVIFAAQLVELDYKIR